MSEQVGKIKSVLRGQADFGARFAQDAQAIRDDVSDLQRRLAATALPIAPLQSRVQQVGGSKFKALTLTAALAVVCLGGVLFARPNTVTPVGDANLARDLPKLPDLRDSVAEETLNSGDHAEAPTPPQCSADGTSREPTQRSDKCQNLARGLDADWSPLWEQQGGWHRAPGFGDNRSRDLPYLEGQWRIGNAPR